MSIIQNCLDELKRLDAPRMLGIHHTVAPAFNRWFKAQYPDIYAHAKRVVSEVERWHRRYDRYTCYTYIHHPELPPSDPYPKAPTASALLADICWALARKADAQTIPNET